VASNELTAGSSDPSKACHELQASTAFFWFLFALFATTTALSFMEGRNSFAGGRGNGMGHRGPSMTQV
jgi:hypothetical protein